MKFFRCSNRRLFTLLVVSVVCACVFLRVDRLVLPKELSQYDKFLKMIDNNKSIQKQLYCEQKDMSKWNFTCKVKCPKFDISDVKNPRKQVMLGCWHDNYNLQMTEVKDDITVPHFKFNDSCLVQTINSSCNSDDLIVPSVVHYVLFGRQPLEFYNLLSIYSAYKKAKPCLIIIHSDFLMFGKYWDYLLQLVPVIIQVIRDPPTHIFSHKIQKVEHQSDWARLQTVQVFGGIYLDTDQVLLRDIQPFRKKALTLCQENPVSLSNAVIFSKRYPKFIDIWKETYFTFDPDGWGEHSILIPFKLAKFFPHLVKVEKITAFMKPALGSGNYIFFSNFDWSKSYGLHLYIRNYKAYYNATIEKLYNPQIIRTLNTTVGAMARYILFDSKELCEN